MAVNLSIKDVPDELAARLRERALRNHRSLQGELMAIVEQAAGSAGLQAASAPPEASAKAATGAAMSSGWKTIEQLLAERRAGAYVPHPSLAQAPLAVDIVRTDRDQR